MFVKKFTEEDYYSTPTGVWKHLGEKPLILLKHVTLKLTIGVKTWEEVFMGHAWVDYNVL